MLVILVIILLCLTIWALFFRQTETAITPKDRPTETVEKNDNAISIPGYEGISFKADEKQQTVALNNPPQNDCYFIITLKLADGTELWQSEKIKPGKQTEAICLNQTLASGNYPAILHYDCYTLDSKMAPLNGAETKLTLHVN